MELNLPAAANDELVQLRGPFYGDAVPRPPELVGAGQTQVALDFEHAPYFLELAYTYQGARWRQRHYYAMVAEKTAVIVSAQAHEDRREAVFRLGSEVAASVELDPRQALARPPR